VGSGAQQVAASWAKALGVPSGKLGRTCFARRWEMIASLDDGAHVAGNQPSASNPPWPLHIASSRSPWHARCPRVGARIPAGSQRTPPAQPVARARASTVGLIHQDAECPGVDGSGDLGPGFQQLRGQVGHGASAAPE
jgi:hypothetical protein